MTQNHTCNFIVTSTEKCFANSTLTYWKCNDCGKKDFTIHEYTDIHRHEIQIMFHELSNNPEKFFALYKYTSAKI